MRWGLGTWIFAVAIVAPLLMATVLLGYLAHQRADAITEDVRTRSAGVVERIASDRIAHDADASGHAWQQLVNSHEVVDGVLIQSGTGRVLFQAPLTARRPSGWPVTVTSAVLGVPLVHRHREPIYPLAGPLQRTVSDGVSPPRGWVTVTTDMTPALAREAVLLGGTAMTALAVVGLCGLLGYAIRRRVVRSIGQLDDAVNELAQGHLGTRAPVFGDADLDRLVEAINRMAMQQERSERQLNEQVAQATRELQETVAAVEDRNAELEIARREALEGSRVKSEFLANMSHEIRTPINGILGFADLLADSRLDDEQQDYVNTIRESGTNLLALVNDILDFSKIEAGKLVIDNVAFDIRNCIEEVISVLAPAAYGKGLELVQLIYQDVPLDLFGDPMRIRQVLTNLVHNAVKFTPQGQVIVRVMLEDEEDDRALIRITVTDTGIGMRESEQQTLFQAFNQADTSVTRRFGGAGLGLIISRKLVEQMGGSLGLHSESGTGSTFWFTLSCLKQRRSESETPPAVSANPLSGSRCLLFETSMLSRLAMRHVLESWDLDVREVSDKATFLSLARASRGWDAIVIGLDREELNHGGLRHLMERLRGLSSPVFVLAATVDRSQLRSLNQQGADSSLPKAVRRQTLYREMCRIMTGPTNDQWQAGVEPSAHRRAIRSDSMTQQKPATAALVVDDNAINRKLISTILRRQGVRVEEAEGGDDAVQHCLAQRFEVVFMDIHMPGMSGEQAADTLRAERRRRGLPIPRIVALTANAMSGERERLLARGMDECLTKPVTEDQVLRQLQGGQTPQDPVTEIGTPAAAAPEQATLASEMGSALLAELPDHRHAIRSAFRRGDLDDLAERTHKLRGAATVCQTPALESACAELERAVRAGERVAIPTGVERVVRAINELLVDKPEAENG
ncbi:MAG: response regulator [Ectothiorhodospiraceae bacterium]